MNRIAIELVAVARELVGMPVFEKAPGFDAAFGAFLAHCQKVYDDYMDANFPTNAREVMKAMEGGRYVRVVKSDASGPRSAHLFVDKTNGDVLKAASWSAPARHARANVFDKGTWRNVGAYGAAYLR